MDLLPYIARRNPWWQDRQPPSEAKSKYKRALFGALAEQAFDCDASRALILIGPRRVGKTFLLMQLIGEAISSKRFKPSNICFLSVDRVPARNTGSLYEVVEAFRSHIDPKRPSLMVFDEIQSCPEWEVQLKALVDENDNIKFITAGSTAQALRSYARETGLGRFSENYLPPILFYEYLDFIGQRPAAFDDAEELEDILATRMRPAQIAKLNRNLKDYLEYGSYPELVFSKQREQSKLDIDVLDMSVIRLMPSMYGNYDTNDLAAVQLYITQHNGLPVNVTRMARSLDINEAKLADLLEYLVEALIVSRTPKLNGLLQPKYHKHDPRFSIVNSSSYSLLRSDLSFQELGIGHRIEAFVRSQMHVQRGTHKIVYIHFTENNKTFEVDLVYLNALRNPIWLTEVKWDDRHEAFYNADRTMAYLLKKKRWIDEKYCPQILVCTSESVYADKLDFASGMTVVPAAQYGYALGLRTIKKHRKVE